MTRRLPLMFLHNAVFVHVSNRLRHNLQILCAYDTILWLCTMFRSLELSMQFLDFENVQHILEISRLCGAYTCISYWSHTGLWCCLAVGCELAQIEFVKFHYMMLHGNTHCRCMAQPLEVASRLLHALRTTSLAHRTSGEFSAGRMHLRYPLAPHAIPRHD